MNIQAECTATRRRIDDLLDDTLSPTDRAQLHAHLAVCEDCAAAFGAAQSLRAALRAMPVPAPRPGFTAAALANAVARNRGAMAGTRGAMAGPAMRPSAGRRPFAAGRARAPRRRVDLWLGGAFGAAAAAAMMVMLWGLPDNAGEPGAAAELRVTLYEPREIGVAIDAARAMPGALLTVTVQGGIDLVGFGAQRELQWHADLEAGTNMLPLPIIAHSLEQGRLTALVEHGNTTQHVELHIQVDAP